MSLLAPYANQAFQHLPRTGVDGNGQATFGSAVDRLGRVEERLRQIPNAQGEIQQSVAQIWTEHIEADPIAAGDRIAYLSRTWQVIAVERPIQSSGASPFLRAYLGAG